MSNFLYLSFEDLDLFCGLKNLLYTAVKSNDAISLENLLVELQDATASQPFTLGQSSVPTQYLSQLIHWMFYLLILERSLSSAVNSAGFTLLHLACSCNSRECVWMLLDHGSDPAAKYGTLVLHVIPQSSVTALANAHGSLTGS